MWICHSMTQMSIRQPQKLPAGHSRFLPWAALQRVLPGFLLPWVTVQDSLEGQRCISKTFTSSFHPYQTKILWPALLSTETFPWWIYFQSPGLEPAVLTRSMCCVLPFQHESHPAGLAGTAAAAPFSKDRTPGATSPCVIIPCSCGQAKFLLANYGFSCQLSPHLDKLSWLQLFNSH